MVRDDAKAWLIMQLKPDHVDASRVESAAVEPGAACNLRCPFCRTGNGTIPPGQRFLTLERFSQVLDRLGSRLKFLSLFRWGEPLLSPDILGMIKRASRRGIATLAHSNLSLPSLDAEAVVASGLSQLSVSCDGASQRTYGQYRVGGSFPLVMRNLSALAKAKKALRMKTPDLRWQFLVHRGNLHELGKAADMAGRLGVKIDFRKLWAPKDWMPAKEQVARALPARGELFEYVPCTQAWDMPGVHSDGSVFPCCATTDARFSLGNILEEPLERIWNKPLIVAMRRYLRAGIKSPMPLPCHGCLRDPNRTDGVDFFELTPLERERLGPAAAYRGRRGADA